MSRQLSDDLRASFNWERSRTYGSVSNLAIAGDGFLPLSVASL
jgi:hypothetical protein